MEEPLKKKIILFISLALIFTIGILSFYKLQKHDPKITEVKGMRIEKYKHDQIYVFQGIYLEKDKNNFNKVLEALEDRIKLNNSSMLNVQDYIIDFSLNRKSSKKSSVRYAVRVDDEYAYVTMPDYSCQVYRLSKKSSKIIIDYLSKC